MTAPAEMPVQDQALLDGHAAAEQRVVGEAARGSTDPFRKAVETMRAASRCAICDKPTAVMNVNTAKTRGFHMPFTAEYLSPQTHCACPDGPLGAAADAYMILFRRYGAKARIYLQSAQGHNELLMQQVVRHSQRGLDFGSVTLASRDAALNILRLVTSPTRADALYERYARERVALIERRGGQIVLKDVRRWVTEITTEHTERISLALYVRDYLNGAVGEDGPFATKASAFDAILADVVRRIGYPLTPHQRGQLELCVTIEWNVRAENEKAEPAEATTVPA